MDQRVKPPVWFWIAAIVVLLWGLAGVASFWMHLSYDPNDPANPAYDNQLYKSLPAALTFVYAVAVGAGLGGAIALLLRRRIAIALFAVSVIAMAVQFGWTFLATDLIAVKGVGIAVGPVIGIVGIGVLGLWLAVRARSRGWIG